MGQIVGSRPTLSPFFGGSLEPRGPRNLHIQASGSFSPYPWGKGPGTHLLWCIPSSKVRSRIHGIVPHHHDPFHFDHAYHILALYQNRDDRSHHLTGSQFRCCQFGSRHLTYRHLNRRYNRRYSGAFPVNFNPEPYSDLHGIGRSHWR